MHRELHLLVLVMLASASCEGYVGARGRVLAADGAPVVGVTVELDGPGYPKRWRTLTAADGCFQLGRTAYPNREVYVLAIAKDGFHPLSATVRGGDTTSEYTIRLAASAESASGAWSKGQPGEVGCDWHRTPVGTDAFFDPKGTQ